MFLCLLTLNMSSSLPLILFSTFIEFLAEYIKKKIFKKVTHQRHTQTCPKKL